MTVSRALYEAASRIEQASIQAILDQLVLRQLKSKNDELLENTLNQLFVDDFNGYDVLIETIETLCSTTLLVSDTPEAPVFHAQLIAAPILVWTRYAIPAPPLSNTLLKALSEQFAQHFLLPDSRLCFAPRLYSIDQLPQGFSATLVLTKKLTQAAYNSSAIRTNSTIPETVPFLADVRFLLGVVVLPSGSALFRWHTPGALNQYENERSTALVSWQGSLKKLLGESILTGCGLDAILPQTYFAACREADRRIRPVSIQAAVHYLTQQLSLRPDQMQAVIAGFGINDEPLEEYRISLTARQEKEVFYGVLWPLYGEESEDSIEINPIPHSGYPRNADREAPLEEIKSILKALGVLQIIIHDDRFSPEFCDDCGNLLYPNPHGELVHPEMPETNDEQSQQLH